MSEAPDLTGGLPSEELTRLEAIAKAATPGPWMWRGNTRAKTVMLMAKSGWGKTVMAFARWGMQSAQPWFNTGDILRDLSEVGVKYEVDYRQDFVDINHPDAQYIAAMSPDVALALIRLVREQGAALAEAEAKGRHGALEEAIEACLDTENDFYTRQAHAEVIGEKGMAKRYIYRAEGAEIIRKTLQDRVAAVDDQGRVSSAGGTDG